MKTSKHSNCRSLLTIPSIIAVLAVAASSRAGTFTYIPGAWGTFTGTGAGNSSSYSADPSSAGISPSLTLFSNNSSQNFTLGATYSFSVAWAASGASDPVPASVTVTFNSQGCLSAFGTGFASITKGTNQLVEMDATNNTIAGFATMLYQTTITIPVVQQADGTYLATGSITTDTLAATWNSGSGGNTSTQEILTMFAMSGNFS